MDQLTDNGQHWMLLVTMLKKTAEKKGISQQMIVERTGLKKSNLSRMFALQQSPTLRTFLLVARAIGVNFFFDDRDGDTNLTAIFEAAMTELGRRPDKMDNLQ